MSRSTGAPRTGARRIRVLEAVAPPDGTTRYIDQVVTYADPGIEFRYFSRLDYFSPSAFLRRADVVHIHWPERLTRGGSRLSSAVKRALLPVLLAVLRARRTAVVRTLHNLDPHESAEPAEARALARIDAATDLWVTINPVTAAPGPSVYIPHGHYRDRFAEYVKSEPVPGRLVYAGLIRPYKGVEALLSAFAATGDPESSLRIAGSPTPELRGLIERVAATDGRVSVNFGFLPDAEFVAEVTTAELVCLPYEELHNSGVLLVALSLDRPVLVPDTSTTRAMSEEVGPGWVHRYQGPLTPQVLTAAAEEIRGTSRSERPRLERRDWEAVASAYGDAFDAAIRTKTHQALSGARPGASPT